MWSHPWKDTKEASFGHQTAIKSSPRSTSPAQETERPQFDTAEGEKGVEAANETGPSGAVVRDRKLAGDPGYC